MSSNPCPPGPLPENIWTVWLGPVPTELTTFAVNDLKTQADHPYGFEWNTIYDGQQVMAIKQHHTWTYHGGKLITGICIPGITLYRQKKVGVTEVPTYLGNPNQEIAWYDDGEPTDWTLIGSITIGWLALIVLFMYVLRRLKGKNK